MTSGKDTRNDKDTLYDMFIIGGGVNGCGIARDAAGRGLSVMLCEKDDLAQATSSASTKLFHGGLRYLEYFQFRMVREALQEREILLGMMPHIAWPLRFVLPVNRALRYANDTSALGRVLGYVPGLKGRRPAWLTRLGLFVYDHIGGRQILPACRTLSLGRHPAGAPLKDQFGLAFEYSDCWVEDSRLVVLNARSAAMHGADILTRTPFRNARRQDGIWHVKIEAPGGRVREVRAKSIVNAAGPWAEAVLSGDMRRGNQHGLRLVRGSHIITKRLFDHAQPYFLQLADGRIIFAIPYERDFTLIGTTDVDHETDPATANCSAAERDYLLEAVNGFFKKQVTADDVVASFSGVRPLYDDKAGSAAATTRDYVLTCEDDAGLAPVLNVFGGKITTYRRLAEHALEKLAPWFPYMGPCWSKTEALPGGHFQLAERDGLPDRLMTEHAYLHRDWAERLVRAYGMDAFNMLAGTKDIDDLGVCFGGTLYAREVDWLRQYEWAMTADDILWRRSKMGLVLDEDAAARLTSWLAHASPVQDVA